MLKKVKEMLCVWVRSDVRFTMISICIYPVGRHIKTFRDFACIVFFVHRNLSFCMKISFLHSYFIFISNQVTCNTCWVAQYSVNLQYTFSINHVCELLRKNNYTFELHFK